MHSKLHSLRMAARFLAAVMIIFGIGYTGLLYGASRLFFPFRAEGSYVTAKNGEMSLLAGQSYQRPDLLWGRLQNFTITEDSHGNPLLYALPSTENPDQAAKKQQAQKIRIAQSNPDAAGPVPAELYTASASGMDPDLSLSAALYQIPRIAKASGLSQAQVRTIIDEHTRKSILNAAGEPIVNVTAVNLALSTLLER